MPRKKKTLVENIQETESPSESVKEVQTYEKFSYSGEIVLVAPNYIVIKTKDSGNVKIKGKFSGEMLGQEYVANAHI